ncbi:MAG TPA: amidase [Candidatus Acidoferrales bacterium]|nr:amidase [Candidatus Acidoferrales bacterium]
MLDEDVYFRPVSWLSLQIQSQKLSPVELTQGYLDRIDKYSSRYNAFVHVTRDLALAQAKAAESEIAAGKSRGPLQGIPWGAKDLLATRDAPTGWGTRFLADQRFDEDATVVQRLHDAGAVMLGKTHCVEFAGCLGYRYPNASVAGPGRNPWDPAHWTGGSSSGSGAAVAAGLCAFALGTETWGSILCPSAFCGLTGLRPTYGAVPRAGAMVGAYTFDKIGPMARTAADCRMVLDVIAGPDPRDPTTAEQKVELKAGSGRPIGQLRGALVTLDWTKSGEPDVKVAFDAALPALRGGGLRLEETTLPDYPASEVSGTLIGVEALAAFETFINDGRVKQLVDPMARYQREIAAPVTGADVMKAWRMRRELQQLVAQFFETYDVIVTPNFKSVAPLATADLNAALSYADPAGAIGVGCGLPAIALPTGFGKGHLPTSLQIMGPPFSEATLLDLGEMFQRNTNHHAEHARVA